MSISNVSAVSAIRNLLLSPIPASGHTATNLSSAAEVRQDLTTARVAKFNEAVSARNGTFVPSFTPDDIAKAQRFSADSVPSQTIRKGGA